jgi:hypothetical protein
VLSQREVVAGPWRDRLDLIADHPSAKETSMELHIVNADPKYEKAHLVEPTKRGYLLVEAVVQPSPGPFPFVFPRAKRSNLLARMKNLARGIEELDGVERVSVFRASSGRRRPASART